MRSCVGEGFLVVITRLIPILLEGIGSLIVVLAAYFMGAFQQLQSLGVLLLYLVYTEVVSRPEIAVRCTCRDKTCVDRANMRSGNEQLSNVTFARIDIELVGLLPSFKGFDWTGMREIGGLVMLQAMQRCGCVHALSVVVIRRARHEPSWRRLATYWLTS